MSMMLRNFLPRLVFTFSLVVSFALWLWVELVFVAALVERFLVRRNGIIEGLVRSTWKVEGYVKEVNGFLICFDGDFEATETDTYCLHL